MAHETPLRALPLQHRPDVLRSVLTERQLRQHGVPPALIAERCRPGGPWQQLLPRVYLLHPGPPSGEQRLQAALLYAGGPTGRGPVMLTGLAALALHGFARVPGPTRLDAVDLLVPHQRRLRDCGPVRIHRTPRLPVPQEVTGLPCAPVGRAVADAVQVLDRPDMVRTVLVESVHGGHCSAAALVGELDAAGLLIRPGVAAATAAAVAEGRSVAEDLLYQLVREHDLPEPLWNVSLHLPRSGAFLAAVDAYWPAHGITLEIDMLAPDPGQTPHPPGRDQTTRRRQALARLGLHPLATTPRSLLETPHLQATTLTALLSTTPPHPPRLRALPR